MKTLAPTIDLATPKVEKFVNGKLLPVFGDGASLSRFYTCEPGTANLENHLGEKWIEANWGAHFICDSISTNMLEEISWLSETINIGEVSIRGAENCKIEVVVWLSARVMRS